MSCLFADAPLAGGKQDYALRQDILSFALSEQRSSDAQTDPCTPECGDGNSVIGPYQSQTQYLLCQIRCQDTHSLYPFFLASEGSLFELGNPRIVRFINAPHMGNRSIQPESVQSENDRHWFYTVPTFYWILTVEAFVISTSDPPCGKRRHKEIFGHQRGVPILAIETPALTICRA